MIRPSESSIDVETAVRERYSLGALERQESLCCPVPAGATSFDHVPQEVIDKDYGCGDPSEFIREGETVLDLGSGAGRICFVASRLVGPHGRVIGVDMNGDMLAVANRYVDQVAKQLGHPKVEFRKGRIQDLQLDLERVQEELEKRPIRTVPEMQRYQSFERRQRRRHPLVATESIDLVVSNCVLNLVPDEEKPGLFREIYRVLRRGGRIAISDIVCDETPTEAMKNDPELWSGCLSGALREDQFVQALEDAGFFGITMEKRTEEPWRVVDGIEFRSVTMTAYKGKDGPCLERRQAVIYRGPWKQVEDDDGHTLFRGERMAVCDKTFKILTSDPYAEWISAVSPRVEVPLADARPFPCGPGQPRRDPRETKEGWAAPAGSGDDCSPGGPCC